MGPKRRDSMAMKKVAPFKLQSTAHHDHHSNADSGDEGGNGHNHVNESTKKGGRQGQGHRKGGADLEFQMGSSPLIINQSIGGGPGARGSYGADDNKSTNSSRLPTKKERDATQWIIQAVHKVAPYLVMYDGEKEVLERIHINNEAQSENDLEWKDSFADDGSLPTLRDRAATQLANAIQEEQLRTPQEVRRELLELCPTHHAFWLFYGKAIGNVENGLADLLKKGVIELSFMAYSYRRGVDEHGMYKAVIGEMSIKTMTTEAKLAQLELSLLAYLAHCRVQQHGDISKRTTRLARNEIHVSDVVAAACVVLQNASEAKAAHEMLDREFKKGSGGKKGAKGVGALSAASFSTPPLFMKIGSATAASTASFAAGSASHNSHSLMNDDECALPLLQSLSKAGCFFITHQPEPVQSKAYWISLDSSVFEVVPMRTTVEGLKEAVRSRTVNSRYFNVKIFAPEDTGRTVALRSDEKLKPNTEGTPYVAVRSSAFFSNVIAVVLIVMVVLFISWMMGIPLDRAHFWHWAQLALFMMAR